MYYREFHPYNYIVLSLGSREEERFKINHLRGYFKKQNRGTTEVQNECNKENVFKRP